MGIFVETDGTGNSLMHCNEDDLDRSDSFASGEDLEDDETVIDDN